MLCSTEDSSAHLGLVGGVLIASSIILFAFRLDSLFGLFIIGVFILLADYIIFDIIS